MWPWEVNQDKFDPAWQQAIYNALIVDDPNMAVVFKGAHRINEDEKLSYGLVYGENEVHIKDRNIETTNIFAGQLEKVRDRRNSGEFLITGIEPEYRFQQYQ